MASIPMDFSLQAFLESKSERVGRMNTRGDVIRLSRSPFYFLGQAG